MEYPRYFVYLPDHTSNFRPPFYTRVNKESDVQIDVYHDREIIKGYFEAEMVGLVETGSWREVKAEELVLILGWM